MKLRHHELFFSSLFIHGQVRKNEANESNLVLQFSGRFFINRGHLDHASPLENARTNLVWVGSMVKIFFKSFTWVTRQCSFIWYKRKNKTASSFRKTILNRLSLSLSTITLMPSFLKFILS